MLVHDQSDQNTETRPTALQVAERVDHKKRMLPLGHAKESPYLRRHHQTKATRDAPKPFNQKGKTN